MIDPNDFVISRRRKKYKFAKFSNSALCYELDDWQPVSDVDTVEVGAGTGIFSVELAARHPERHYVAVDVKADRLQKGAYEAEERGLTNIRFLRARADQLIDCFQAHSLSTIWLTFADPFPKKRSAGRRMSHPTYLAVYRTLLSPGGSFLLKHDSPDFFSWSLEQLVSKRWSIQELSFDLHDSDLESDYKIMTSYETRWVGEGRTTALLRAAPPSAQHQ